MSRAHTALRTTQERASAQTSLSDSPTRDRDGQTLARWSDFNAEGGPFYTTISNCDLPATPCRQATVAGSF